MDLLRNKFSHTAVTYLREGKKFDRDDTHTLFMETLVALQEVLLQSRLPYMSEFRNTGTALWNHVRSLAKKGFNDLAIDQLDLVVQFREASKCPPSRLSPRLYGYFSTV